MTNPTNQRLIEVLTWYAGFVGIIIVLRCPNLLVTLYCGRHWSPTSWTHTALYIVLFKKYLSMTLFGPKWVKTAWFSIRYRGWKNIGVIHVLSRANWEMKRYTTVESSVIAYYGWHTLYCGLTDNVGRRGLLGRVSDTTKDKYKTQTFTCTRLHILLRTTNYDWFNLRKLICKKYIYL